MKERTPYELDLHETRTYPGTGGYTVIVTRVPGGWLYRVSGQDSGCFVPFSTEFINSTPAEWK